MVVFFIFLTEHTFGVSVGSLYCGCFTYGLCAPTVRASGSGNSFATASREREGMLRSAITRLGGPNQDPVQWPPPDAVFAPLSPHLTSGGGWRRILCAATVAGSRLILRCTAAGRVWPLRRPQAARGASDCINREITVNMHAISDSCCVSVSVSASPRPASATPCRRCASNSQGYRLDEESAIGRDLWFVIRNKGSAY